MPDGPLTETRLREALRTRLFRFEPRIGSTNDLARQWAQEGAPPGAVVIAEEQTQGRGRSGRTWTAPAGSGLLMSVILRPNVDPLLLPRLTAAAALAAYDGIEAAAAGQAVTLKWPNDVKLSGRKVAGILTEATWQGDNLAFCIVGIGINVSVDFEGTELIQKAISIESVTGQTVDRALLAGQILLRIDFWKGILEQSPADVIDAWRQRLDTLGQRVTAHAADREISGEAVDVDDDGALLLRTDNGLIHRVVAGEVTLSDDRV